MKGNSEAGDDETRTVFVDRPDRRRFELLLDGEPVAHADYSLDPEGGVLVVSHVETAPEHRGNGHAAQLMAAIVDHLRASRRRIRPLCWYAAGYLRERPDTHDLVDH